MQRTSKPSGWQHLIIEQNGLTPGVTIFQSQDVTQGSQLTLRGVGLLACCTQRPPKHAALLDNGAAQACSGLCMCRHMAAESRVYSCLLSIMVAHDGAMTAESQVDQLSDAHVTLCMKKDEHLHTPRASACTPHARPHTIQSNRSQHTGCAGCPMLNFQDSDLPDSAHSTPAW